MAAWWPLLDLMQRSGDYGVHALTAELRGWMPRRRVPPGGSEKPEPDPLTLTHPRLSGLSPSAQEDSPQRLKNIGVNINKASTHQNKNFTFSVRTAAARAGWGALTSRAYQKIVLNASVRYPSAWLA